MTDKKQIIIDGVDVSECGHFYIRPEDRAVCCTSHVGENCGVHPYCTFKQLARKTQECEQKDERIIELTKEALSFKQECEQKQKIIEELKERKLKLELNETHNKNEIKKLKKRIHKDREFFKNKISSLTLARKQFLEALDHFNWQIGLVKNDRYRKALEEIENFMNYEFSGKNEWVKKCILDIINKVRGGEDE